MRIIKMLALVIALGAVPALEAQQAVAPRFTEQPLPRLGGSAQLPTRGVPSRIAAIPAPADAPESAAAAAREISAIDVLTIIGAIVVVVAVIGLVI